MLPPVLLAAFPGLASDDAVITHPPSSRFNCLAWGCGIVNEVLWPNGPDATWPADIPKELSLATVAAVLEKAGYIACDNGDVEIGFEKAAIYARDGVPTHVARQLPGGRWSSKLGRDCVVSHATVSGVEGMVYGTVVAYLERPIRQTA